MTKDLALALVLLVLSALPGAFISVQFDEIILFPFITVVFYSLLQFLCSFLERWCTVAVLLIFGIPVSIASLDLALPAMVGSVASGCMLPLLTKKARKSRSRLPEG